ncbi:hypothetical protein [Amnibacterium sp.]|uniref:hypothetical protein n=1 Tax=Amnibacterium sp. TaxID=1872496 RepID=UPI00261A00BD|nr:hypothetical protein [Amnibacterium sp.]MCU1472282.1 hypothetical protein [Amnibacterium sp.]
MTPTRIRGARSIPTAVALTAAVLLGCTACTSTPPAGTHPSGSAIASSSPPPTAASPSAAARAERTRIDAALAHRVVWLEYLCSVPSAKDPGLTYVALHERTTWRASGSTASLDVVLAQPVRRVQSGGWTAAGSPVAIRSVRNGRLASDAIVGLVGPAHRCSASYIGPPVAG